MNTESGVFQEEVEKQIASKPGHKRALSTVLTSYIPISVKKFFLKFDRKVDGALSFFIKHYGKSRFMVAMSKKAQYLGIEKLWYKGPKAFIYFFLFYLIRDTILYIIIPIFFAKLTTA